MNKTICSMKTSVASHFIRLFGIWIVIFLIAPQVSFAAKNPKDVVVDPSGQVVTGIRIALKPELMLSTDALLEQASPAEFSTAEGSAAATENASAASHDQIRLEILEIKKSGGRVTEVILNGGTSAGVAKKMEGVLTTTTGRVVAGLRIIQVDEIHALAEVTMLGPDLNQNAVAVLTITPK